MIDQEDDVNLGEMFFGVNNQGESVAFLEQILSWVALEVIFQKFVTKQLIGWDFYVVQRDIFHPHQDKSMVISTRNLVFLSLVRPSETGKSQLIYNWLKLEHFNQNLRNVFSYQHSQPLYDVMLRKLTISNLFKV